MKIKELAESEHEKLIKKIGEIQTMKSKRFLELPEHEQEILKKESEKEIKPLYLSVKIETFSEIMKKILGD